MSRVFKKALFSGLSVLAFGSLLLFFQNCGPARLSGSSAASSSVVSPSRSEATPTPAPTATPSPTPANGFRIVTPVQITQITSTSAVISWGLSDYATGQHEYGTTLAYGTLGFPEESFKYRTHVQDVENLFPGATYHIRVKSMDMFGQIVVSPDVTFTTLP